MPANEKHVMVKMLNAIAIPWESIAREREDCWHPHRSNTKANSFIISESIIMIFCFRNRCTSECTLNPFLKKKPLWSEIDARLLQLWNKTRKKRANREEWKTEILKRRNLAWSIAGWDGITTCQDSTSAQSLICWWLYLQWSKFSSDLYEKEVYRIWGVKRFVCDMSLCGN